MLLTDAVELLEAHGYRRTAEELAAGDIIAIDAIARLRLTKTGRGNRLADLLEQAGELRQPETCSEPFTLTALADQLVCTRPEGHDGRHEATALAVWGDGERWSLTPDV